jgi:signal transduction histidine kinase
MRPMRGGGTLQATSTRNRSTGSLTARHAGAVEPSAPGSLLHEIAALLEPLGLKTPAARTVLRRALSRADELREAGGGSRTADLQAAFAFAADALSGLAVEGRWPRREITVIMHRLAEASRAPLEAVAASIYPLAARDPQLTELSPLVAVETHLRLLISLPQVTEASVWSLEPTGKVRCLLRVGTGKPTRSIGLAARSVFADTRGARGPNGLVHAFPVSRWERTVGSLVLKTAVPRGRWAQLVGEEAASVLGGVLGRQALLERGAARERALVAASERRLTRFGLDLHDGPIQDLHAMVGDLRLFRSQLAADDVSEVLMGRVEEFASRLLRVDADVRDLARSFESVHIAMRPLAELLSREVDGFRRDAGIETTAQLSGDFDDLTASQQLALMRIVQEALTNARDHSGASHVSITVKRHRSHVSAEITDDGCGFEVEPTLARAARAGRLGLVGMSERVRLLGGVFDVTSRPGGPTKISVTLPSWRPLPIADDVALAR